MISHIKKKKKKNTINDCDFEIRMQRLDGCRPQSGSSVGEWRSNKMRIKWDFRFFSLRRGRLSWPQLASTEALHYILMNGIYQVNIMHLYTLGPPVDLLSQASSSWTSDSSCCKLLKWGFDQQSHSSGTLDKCGSIRFRRKITGTHSWIYTL